MSQVSQPTTDPSSLPVAAPAATLRGRLAATWSGLALPWASIVLVAGVGLVAAGQLAEDSIDTPGLQLLTPDVSIRRWTLILVVLYLIATSRYVDRLVERSAATLDRAFASRSPAYERDSAELRRLAPAVELLLFLVSMAVVLLLYAAGGLSLPTDDPTTKAPVYLPPFGLPAILIVVEYAVVGWSMVSLLANTIRRARAVGRLSREPLAIDVFDTSNLIGLGNIALGTSLAPAGVIVILLMGFGRPSQPVSLAVLGLAILASLLALILPLRGIHGQMARAKQQARSRLNAQLRAAYDRLESGRMIDAAESGMLNGRVGTLATLRKSVDEMTTWPFRDTLAFGRALLIASAPLLYTVISELIKVFWINNLTP